MTEQISKSGPDEQSPASVCSDWPTAQEMRAAAGVCTRIVERLNEHIPWWKRWMYELDALKTVAEKLSVMSVTMENRPNNYVTNINANVEAP